MIKWVNKLSEIYEKQNANLQKIVDKFDMFIKKYTSYQFITLSLISVLIFLNLSKILNFLFPFGKDDYSSFTSESSKIAYLLAQNEYSLKFITLVGGIFGIILAVWRVIVADKNYKNEVAKLEHQKKELSHQQAQFDLNIKSQYKRERNERFFKAVQLLNSEDMTARIGGLYSLIQILKEDKIYYKSSLEIFTNYVQSRTKIMNESASLWFAGYKSWEETKAKCNSKPTLRKLDRDIIIALSLLNKNFENEKIDLKNLDWKFIDFKDVSFDFKNLDLSSSDLTGSDFLHKEIQKCNFYRCKLDYAAINHCIVKDCWFNDASMKKIFMMGSDFSQYNMIERLEILGANIQYCNFTESYLSDLADAGKYSLENCIMDKTTYEKNIKDMNYYIFVPYNELDKDSLSYFDICFPQLKDKKGIGVLKPKPFEPRETNPLSFLTGY